MTKTLFSQYPRVHDYSYLIKRWRKCARHTGLRIQPFAEASGHQLFFLETKNFRSYAPTIYLSAGIHGDEPASTEALLDWVQKNEEWSRQFSLLIFPCLNPWGLLNNSRYDSEHRDLNRCFARDDIPQISAQRNILASRRFDLALILHEDYDAQGVYLYEIQGHKPYWGEELLKKSASFIPTEPRRQVEGRTCRDGLIRRKITPDLIKDWPEAFTLYFHHTSRVFTLETPSEFLLDTRIAAHHAMMDHAIKKCLLEKKKNAKLLMH